MPVRMKAEAKAKEDMAAKQALALAPSAPSAAPVQEQGKVSQPAPSSPRRAPRGRSVRNRASLVISPDSFGGSSGGSSDRTGINYPS
jgi:hypothetical protein